MDIDDILKENSGNPEDDLVAEIIDEVKSMSAKEESEKKARSVLTGEFSDEIFSTTSKKIKTKTTNPLDLTGEISTKSILKADAKPVANITTKSVRMKHLREEDTKTDETMNASRLMDEKDEYEKVEEDFLHPDRAVNRRPAKTGPDEDFLPENPIDEQDYKTVNYESDDEPISAIDEDVSEIEQSGLPHYDINPELNHFSVKGGSFSPTVRDEYEEYMSVLIEEKAKELEQLEEKEKQKNTVRAVKRGGEGIASKLSNFFDTGEDDEIDNDGEGVEEEYIEEAIADYHSKADEKSIFSELNFRIRSTTMKAAAMFILMLVSFTIVILQAAIPDKLTQAIENAPAIISIINVVLIIFGAVVSLSTITNGLTPLSRFKGNSDTAVAVGVLFCIVQAIAGLFFAQNFYDGVFSYYTAAALVALFANACGKSSMVRRIKDNFKFLTSRRRNYSVELLDDAELSREMASGTAAAEPIIAYQNKTEFLNDFLKLSYAQDKCEVVCSRLAPVTSICVLLLAILYGIMKTTALGAISFAALLSVIAIPVCDLLVVNLPLRRFGKELLKKQAMMSGYPAVMRFSNVNAVTIDANDLYSRDSVTVVGLKTFESRFEKQAINSAYAALDEAKSPQAQVLKKLKSKYKIENEIKASSFVYEDGLGIVAWVQDERVLVGNEELMKKYGIYVPSSAVIAKAKKTTSLTFIAYAGELCIMLELEYKPSKAVLVELQRAELNGISILVPSTDCNITQEKIAKDFDVYYRSVKVLSPGHTVIVKDKQSAVKANSKAYLATKGSPASLLRVLSGCLKLRSSFNVGIILQVVSVLLGVVLIATLCMFSSVSHITTIGVLIYMAFWFIAVIVAQRIHRP